MRQDRSERVLEMQTLLQRGRLGWQWVLALVCVIGLSAPLAAQDPRGAIAGKVLDSSGGARQSPTSRDGTPSRSSRSVDTTSWWN
jgi:hypothetical protein